MSANYNPYVTRINRPKRQIIGPSQQFVQDEVGTERPMAAGKYLGSDSGGFESEQPEPVDLGMSSPPDQSDAETQRLAADNSTSAPHAAKRYVDAYMADPEWQKAHASEDDIVDKLAPNIGNVLLDRITRGSYSRSRYAQLEAARHQKASVEKRYLDMYNLDRQAALDARQELNDSNANATSAQNYRKTEQDLEKSRIEAGFTPTREQAAIDHINAQTESLRAGASAITAGIPRKGLMNVPANTNVIDTSTMDPNTGQYPTVAQGPDRQFNQVNPPRDYSEVTGSTRAQIRAKAMDRMFAQQSEDARMGIQNELSGKSRQEIYAMADEEASMASNGGGSSTPVRSAAPQYTNPAAAGTGMWSNPGSQGPPLAPTAPQMPHKRLGRIGPNGELLK